MSRDSRFSIGMSLFLFRKTLPSPPPVISDFLRKMAEDSPEPDATFMDFIRDEVPRLFRTGWDSVLYERAVDNSVLSTSSCVQRGRGKGGCRAWALGGGSSIFDGRASFIESVLSSRRYPALKPSRVVAVPDAGKYRVVTVADGELSLLRPLHTAMYDHLSRFPWLLRGDAKASRFSDFSHSESEVFVSGDYESATDNLNIHVQREILRLVLQQCRSVPHSIQVLAMQSLGLQYTDGKEVFTQGRGQMMGYLLSFPLLCLVNFLCFKFAVPRKVPLKINGDDIVFRSTLPEFLRWKETVARSGLVLSEGKTLVDRRYFTLNSSLFAGTRSGCRAVPFIRAKSFFTLVKEKESIRGLVGRFFSFCPGFTGRRRSLLRTWWLRENRGLIMASRRSLSRGLGLPVKLDELMRSCLWDREAWYLSFPAERPLPSPFSEWSRRPKGYEYHRVYRVTKEIKNERRQVAAAFVAAAWEDPLGDEDRWEEDLVQGLPDFCAWSYQRRRGLIRRAELLRMSVPNTRRFLRPNRELFLQRPSKPPSKGVWRPANPTRASFAALPAVERTGSVGESTTNEMDRWPVELVSHTVCGPDGSTLTGELVGFPELFVDPPPAYSRYGGLHAGPILPPSELTTPVPGRTIMFRHGCMSGFVGFSS